MKKTFVIGFLGFVLVSGFVTGLYLINKETNPASSAHEDIVSPVKPPETVGGQGQFSVTPGQGEPTREECTKSFGKAPDDPAFVKICDVNQDGKIDILDLAKLK